MKTLTLLIALILFNSCSNQIAADKLSDEFPQPTPTTTYIDSANANPFHKVVEISLTENKKRVEELTIQNEKFTETPEEFKFVDWENFQFDDFKLNDGEFEFFQHKKFGNGKFGLDSVYYVDLTGDAKKEAIVVLYKGYCGGSCDGGRKSFYFYKSENGKAKLIDFIDTGSLAYGCATKSMTVKDKKIYLEQFGNCKEKTDVNEDKSYPCKYCVKDLTKSLYSINTNSKLTRETVEIIEAPITKVNNYISEISIIE